MHDEEHKGEKEEEIIFSRGTVKLVGCKREEENPTHVRSWVENCGIVKFIEFRCKCFFYFSLLVHLVRRTVSGDRDRKWS
jgi:hypothetical protein